MAKKTTEPKVSVCQFSFTVNGKTVEGTGSIGEAMSLLGEAMAGRDSALDVAAKQVVSSATAGRSTAGWEQVRDDAATFRRVYRAAAKRHHPDLGGGQAAWERLQASAEILKKRRGAG